MPEEQIETIEAQEEGATDAAAHYECAFHALPTIADMEVSKVVDNLKFVITRSGGTVIGEEVSSLYSLAYEIVKPVDGASRRFNAAHFGWVRFILAPQKLASFTEECKHMPELLRYMVIRLTREEIRTPFSIVETPRPHGGADSEEFENEQGKSSASSEVRKYGMHTPDIVSSVASVRKHGIFPQEPESHKVYNTGTVALNQSLEHITAA